jgi:hypothetical protein
MKARGALRSIPSRLTSTSGPRGTGALPGCPAGSNGRISGPWHRTKGRPDDEAPRPSQAPLALMKRRALRLISGFQAAWAMETQKGPAMVAARRTIVATVERAVVTDPA